jgi:hypothetical protein
MYDVPETPGGYCENPPRSAIIAAVVVDRNITPRPGEEL